MLQLGLALLGFLAGGAQITPGEEEEGLGSDRFFKWLGLRKLGSQLKCIYLEKRLCYSTATFFEIRHGFFLLLWINQETFKRVVVPCVYT